MNMTTPRKHWLCWAAWLIASAALCHGGDLVVTYSDPANILTTERKADVERMRSLADWLVVSNGLPAGHDVITVILRPTNLGSSGPLAQTSTAHYMWNDRGKLVLDGQYPCRIDLNTAGGLATWPAAYFRAVILHELLHCWGFDSATFYGNGLVGGTLFALNDQYTGPALATYRAEFDFTADFIPMDGPHFAELMSPPELMTPGLSNSGIAQVYLSRTMLAVMEDNGVECRVDFEGGLLSALTPSRRLPDEGGVIVVAP